MTKYAVSLFFVARFSLLVVLSPVPAAANLVINGSFKFKAITPATSGYTNVTDGGPNALYPEGTYAIGADPRACHNLFA